MRIRTTIELKEGATVRILVTPALYRIAEQKGLDIIGETDKKDPYSAYIKILYCAAVNAWEVDAVDIPGLGEFPYKYADFIDWAWEDKDRLGKITAFIYEALTGKPLKDAVAEEVKKKKRTT